MQLQSSVLGFGWNELDVPIMYPQNGMLNAKPSLKSVGCGQVYEYHFTQNQIQMILSWKILRSMAGKVRLQETPVHDRITPCHSPQNVSSHVIFLFDNSKSHQASSFNHHYRVYIGHHHNNSYIISYNIIDIPWRFSYDMISTYEYINIYTYIHILCIY